MALAHNRRRRFSLRGFLQLTRFPNLLIIALTQYMSAVFLVSHPENGYHRLLSLELFLLSLATLMVAAAGYIINDYYDIKIDYVNKPDRVVVGKLINRRIVLVSHGVLNVLGICIGFYLSLKVGVIIFLAGFILWYYSNRLKRLPLIGNVSIALLTSLSIIIIAVYYRQNESLLMAYAVFAFSINLVREIIKDMEDIRGDMRFGSKTLPIVLGFRRTKYLLYGLIALFILILFVLAGRLGNSVLNVFFIGLIAPIAYLVYLLFRADTQKRFHRLSSFCKILMLAGILSMSFF
jgi:4-hydroxybenzoate polyprenyltransferase